MNDNDNTKGRKIKVSIALLASLDSDIFYFRKDNRRLYQDIDQLTIKVDAKETEIVSLNRRIKGFEAIVKGDVQIIDELRNRVASLESALKGDVSIINTLRDELNKPR